MRGCLVLALLAFAGCDQRVEWQKIGGAREGEFAVTRARCEARAYSVFPRAPETVQTSSGYLGASQTQCLRFGANIQCNTRPGVYEPPGYTTVDTATGPRRRQFEACMIEAGWRQTSGR